MYDALFAAFYIIYLVELQIDRLSRSCMGKKVDKLIFKFKLNERIKKMRYSTAHTVIAFLTCELSCTMG